MADSPVVTDCQPYIDIRPALQIVLALIVFILAAIIAWMLIVARRRDRRLSRNDGGRQAGAEVPP